MSRNVVIIVLFLLLILAWAPWMNRESTYARVTDKYRVIGISEGGTGCDYQVMWAPFGRWVVNCEEGHFILFSGTLLF